MNTLERRGTNEEHDVSLFNHGLNSEELVVILVDILQDKLENIECLSLT